MILLLGGKGYIASAFAGELSRSGAPFRVLSRADADYTDRGVLGRVIGELRPEFLINAAGYTGKPNVDACEEDRVNCLFGNAVFPGYVREVCEEARLPWGHVSSGCIYSGEKPGGAGFTEEDEPNFCFRTGRCSFYSGSKALGEEVLQGAERCYIWRIRIPFNHEDHPRNYLTKLVTYDRLLDAKNSISHLNEAVRASLQCWEKRIFFGIYNVTNPGAVTTRDIVGWMEEESERRKGEGSVNPFDRDYRFFDSEEEFLGKAAKARRSSCVLDSSKLLGQGIWMTPAEEAVRGSLRDWKVSGNSVSCPAN